MAIEQQISQYLEVVLGAVAPKVEPCPHAGTLPYYFQNAFKFKQVELSGNLLILAIHQDTPGQHLREIRIQLARVQEILQKPVIYCPLNLASYERRNLIEQKVPFIVPGNQMYLPDLGIDLREHFRHKQQKQSNLFTPSTQALIIWHLLNMPTQNEWAPSDIAVALGYTPMTSSRAIHELVDAHLAEEFSVGRKKYLRMLQSHEITWQNAKPFMRSPVKKKIWIIGNLKLYQSEIRLAGLSGLSERTLLADSSEKCYAITSQQWRDAMQEGVKEIPMPESNSIQLEIWAYSPAMESNSRTVDPLSLWLSLKNISDDRVQMALDELQENIKW